VFAGMKKGSLVALAAIAGSTALAAAIGGTRKGQRWYARLKKPGLTPPGVLFPIVWTALYTLQAVSAFRVWRAPKSPERTRALALWGTQLALNGAWSPLFFRAQSPRLAFADILALDGALAGYVHGASKVDRTAAWLASPYLAWVGFATYLNEEIVRLNP